MFFRISATLSLVTLVSLCSLNAQNASAPRDASTSSAAVVDPDTAYQMAVEIDQNGNSLPKAIAAYRGFLKLHPASPKAAAAQYRLAQLIDESGNASKAFDAYQTLITRYPDTPEFEQAVAQQVIIANQFLQGRRLSILGLKILPGSDRAQEMYAAILKNAPFSRHAPVAQFNLGLSYERQRSLAEARSAYQTVLDKYPNSDVADDAMYQIGYIYMQASTTGNSQDLSALVLARETFEDFLLQYPRSEKAAQARENLVKLGSSEAGDLMRIARYYDWSKDYKAAALYYNDIIRKQPQSEDAKLAKTRIDELRAAYGDETLRIGTDRAESGEQLALRRRLQSQVETSSLADYAGPPKRDIVPDELPVTRAPKLRTNVRDVQPLPSVEPLLPVQ